MVGLTQAIQIVRFTGAKDGAGDIIETQALLYSGWAEIKNVSGSRRFLDRPLSEKTFLFKIKNRPLIVPVITDTVVYLGRRFTVQDVSRSEERRFTYEILANGTGQGVGGTISVFNNVFNSVFA